MSDRVANWITEAGGKIGPLRVRQGTEGERGIFADASIASGERVVEIPERCLITAESARRYLSGRLVAGERFGQSSDQFWLTVFLLEQQLAPDPWWSPYVASLPRSFQHFPLFFDDSDLDMLDGSSIKSVIHRRRIAYAQEFRNLAKLVPKFRDKALNEYFGARVTVMSRAFTLNLDGMKRQALVPFADMFNNSVSYDVDWGFDCKKRTFFMECGHGVDAGAAVHDSYGKKSNTRLLQNYGFVVDNNPHDDATIWITTPNWAPATERRSREFGYADNGRRRFRLPHVGEQAVDAISFLRLVYAKDRELEMQLKVDAGPVPFISACNERKVMEALGRACEDALRLYASTISDDDALLTRGDLRENSRRCVIVRRGEKAVLRKWIHLTTEKLRDLN